MGWHNSYLIVFAVALITTLVATPFARRIAISLDAVDYPSARRVNKEPIPRMGGIAVACSLLAVVLVQAVGTTLFGWPSLISTRALVGLNYPMLILSFVIIFATGFIDDLIELTPIQKLVGQVLAASVAAAGGLVIGDVVHPIGPGELSLGWLAYPVTVVYLVAFSNIINLIDGLDGLASGVTCISAITMFVHAILAGRVDAAVLSATIAGSTLGFLRYNFNPASIFLGDCGALFLGFSLGTISLLAVRRVAGITTLVVPIVIAGIPIMDTFSAIIRRRRAGVSVGQADRGHIHHRLIAEGFNQKQAVLLIYAWTAFLSAGSILMTQVNAWLRAIVLMVLIGVSFMFAFRLHLFEPVIRHHFDPKIGEDRLVTPDDPAFEVEVEREEEQRELRREQHEEVREELREEWRRRFHSDE
ncbi:MAG: undecaprenyl/decaprenyl-phosphate alpha-N-acetylglucosaminyl 1-phosphate transferase [Atopobiaceae bacterium]|nr:undecaprenyl/decaprenyl-phosphate alpha-N-acetylglucosaminyl 1-phosphate transferase [Atopobiaceae bacterium]